MFRRLTCLPAIRAGCGYTAEDGVVTSLTGDGTWTHERYYIDYAPSGSWITAYEGSFNWTKSTGESGFCTYDLTKTIDTGANTRTLVGESCGSPVDNSRTWPG